jgi:hypothetical protein
LREQLSVSCERRESRARRAEDEGRTPARQNRAPLAWTNERADTLFACK